MGRGADEDSLKRIENKGGNALLGALQNHQAPVLVFSTDGAIIASNGSAQGHFSCRPDDFRNLKIDDLLQDPYSIADLERKGQKRSHLLLKRDNGLETAVLATANVASGQHMWVFETAPETGRIRPMLSERERQILSVLADGANNGEIAYAFGIAGTTVQQHIASLKRKLEAATRAQMIERAIAHRFLHARSAQEVSLIQSIAAVEGGQLKGLTVNYIDHNTLRQNPESNGQLNRPAKDLIEQESLHREILEAIEEQTRQAFVDKLVRPAWKSKSHWVEGSIDPLPGDKFILRLVF